MRQGAVGNLLKTSGVGGTRAQGTEFTSHSCVQQQLPLGGGGICLLSSLALCPRTQPSSASSSFAFQKSPFLLQKTWEERKVEAGNSLPTL